MAATHPNSFLDAIIINLILDRPVWSLARGDVFRKKWARWLVTQINMFPIYRLSEGRENMIKNDQTFEQVKKFMLEKEQVLIFSEGLCANQTKLLPLKKGTGRMVQIAWEEDIEVAVIPVGITYNHLKGFEKMANLNFGTPIEKHEIPEIKSGTFLREFNDILEKRLNALLSWRFKPKKFGEVNSPLYYVGWAINFPWYFLIKFISKTLTKGTVHYDSVTFGILAFTLPIYWLILGIIGYSMF